MITFTIPPRLETSEGNAQIMSIRLCFGKRGDEIYDEWVYDCVVGKNPTEIKNALEAVDILKRTGSLIESLIDTISAQPIATMDDLLNNRADVVLTYDLLGLGGSITIDFGRNRVSLEEKERGWTETELIKGESE